MDQQQKNKNILSLDQSSRITGYGIFNLNGELISFGKFDLGELDLEQRLVEFRKKIISLIENNNIGYVIHEDIQLQGNVINNIQTFKVLSEIYGVLQELLTEINIKHESVYATAWKTIAGIKKSERKKEKKDAQEIILNKYNKKVTQDEADAILIGHYFFNKQKSAW